MNPQLAKLATYFIIFQASTKSEPRFFLFVMHNK